MAQDAGEGPKGSSWHSWVRGSGRRRADDAAAPPPASAGLDDLLAPDADLDNGPSPAPGPASDGGDDPDVTLSWPGARDDRPPTLDDPGDDDHVAAIPALDDGLDDGIDDAHDDGDGGDLLPAVPLLPSIAGRVDALGAMLRTIAMRVDSLAATTNAFRSAVTDSIDEYADVVTTMGRQSDQNLDEYRRANERTVSELRRGLAEHDDLLHRASARLDELSTDVAALVDLVRLSVSELRSRPDPAPVPAAAAVDPAVAEQLEAVRNDLGYLRGMIDVVVDTMPASTEGSAGPPLLADHQLDRIVDRLASRLLAAAPPSPPAPAPRPAQPAPKSAPKSVAKPAKAAPKPVRSRAARPAPAPPPAAPNKKR